jgi:hypothetical protein
LQRHFETACAREAGLRKAQPVGDDNKPHELPHYRRASNITRRRWRRSAPTSGCNSERGRAHGA